MKNKPNTNTNKKMTQEEIEEIEEMKRFFDLKKKEIEEVNLKRKEIFKKMSEIEDETPFLKEEIELVYDEFKSRKNMKKKTIKILLDHIRTEPPPTP